MAGGRAGAEAGHGSARRRNPRYTQVLSHIRCRHASNGIVVPV